MEKFVKNKENKIYFSTPLNAQIFCFLCFGRGSNEHYIILETGPFYVAQAGLERLMLLPQPPECWDYRYVLLDPVKILNYFQN
jgi:hypothetical protein